MQAVQPEGTTMVHAIVLVRSELVFTRGLNCDVLTGLLKKLDDVRDLQGVYIMSLLGEKSRTHIDQAVKQSNLGHRVVIYTDIAVPGHTGATVPFHAVVAAFIARTKPAKQAVLICDPLFPYVARRTIEKVLYTGMDSTHRKAGERAALVATVVPSVAYAVLSNDVLVADTPALVEACWFVHGRALNRSSLKGYTRAGSRVAPIMLTATEAINLAATGGEKLFRILVDEGSSLKELS